MNKLLLSLVFLASAAHAAPDWIDDRERARSCDDGGLYCGFGMAVYGDADDKADCLRLAENGALADLARRISVRIRAENESILAQDDKNESVKAQSAVLAVSDIEITGAKKQTYTDPAQATCYAFASATRKSLRELYLSKASASLKRIKAAMADAAAKESAGDRDGALAAYLSVYPLTDKLEQARSVAHIAGAKLPESLDFDPGAVRLAVTRLINKPVASPDDLAWQLAYILKGQVTDPPDVDISPISYQDKSISTAFSRYFHGVLKAALVQTAGWKVEDEYKGGIHAVGAAADRPSHLKGNYWPVGDKYRVSVFLMGPDGRIDASAQVVVSSEVLASSGQNLEPDQASVSVLENDGEALDEASGSGLELYSWTSKGVANPVLYAGESADVYARVNIPAYVTAFFVPYEGKGLILEENFHVERNRVNKRQDMATPLINNMRGQAGILYVFASTAELPPVGASLEGAVTSAEKTAFLKALSVRSAGGAKVAERRIVVTFSSAPASVRRAIIRPYLSPSLRRTVAEEKTTAGPVRENVIRQSVRNETVYVEESRVRVKKERVTEVRSGKEHRKTTAAARSRTHGKKREKAR